MGVDRRLWVRSSALCLRSYIRLPSHHGFANKGREFVDNGQHQGRLSRRGNEMRRARLSSLTIATLALPTAFCATPDLTLKF